MPAVLSLDKKGRLTGTIFENEQKEKTVTMQLHPDLKVIFQDKSSGVTFWLDESSRIRYGQFAEKAVELGTIEAADSYTSFTITELSPQQFLFHFSNGEESSWLESYKLEGAKLTRQLTWPKMDGTSFISVNSATSVGFGPLLFAWTRSSGSSQIFSSNNVSVLADFRLQSSPARFSAGISEILQRADSTYAIRSFVVSEGGDASLIRNSDVLWTRKESLAGSKAATWVELLDPKTEEIRQEVEMEAHQGVLGAWLHRTRRHLNELSAHGPAWAKALPNRILSNIYARNQSNEVAAEAQYRDGFGYRKILVILTKSGRLTAIDVGRKGKVIWEIQAKMIEEADSVQNFIQTSKRRLSLIAKSGKYVDIDPFSGSILQSKALGHEILTTAVVDGPQGKAVLAVYRTSEGLRSLSLTDSEPQEPVYLVYNTGHNSLSGLRIDGGHVVETWTFTPPKDGILGVLKTRPQHDPVASIGRVLLDRSVMYKYLNQHVLFASVVSPSTSTLNVYLFDMISGAELYSSKHQSVDVGKSTAAVLSENWLVYSFYADDEFLAGGPQGYQMISVELFESPIKNDRGRLGASESSSSLNSTQSDGHPYVEARAYMFPSGIASAGTTTTLQGISSHDIVLYLTPSNNLLSVSKRAISAVRPLDRDPNESEREEGLARYMPVLSVEPSGFLNHQRSLKSRSGLILTTPTSLESTSIVLFLGDIDIFGTRVSPSLEFDVLGKGFNRLQLIGTVIALAVGVAIVRPMVDRKTVERKWRGQG